MKEDIAQRITKDLGLPELTNLLAEKLSGSDLHSIMLAVLKRRVGKIEPFALTQPSAVTRACDLDGRLLNQLEAAAYASACGFDAVELSPLSPLGAVASLTGLDQANVLSTIRAFECASDPTVGMALECARRRKQQAGRKALTRLCTNQRVVRFPLPQNPGFTSHFKLFSLVTAGRDRGSFAFELEALTEHIACYLSFMSKLNEGDFAFEQIVVELSDTRAIARLCQGGKIDREEIRSQVRARDSSSSAKILEQCDLIWPRDPAAPAEQLKLFNLSPEIILRLELLRENSCLVLGVKFPHVRFELNLHRLTGLGYYQGPCFHIKSKNESGQMFMLGDGGFVDWTQRLLSDGKERLMTSAIGTELISRMFGRNCER